MARRPHLARRQVLAGLSACTVAPAASATPVAAAPAQFDLWPDGPPDPPRIAPTELIFDRSADPAQPDRILSGVARPRLDHYAAINPTGAAVLIAPGGGYEHLAIDREGAELGRWLSAQGVAVFVLNYRLPGGGWAEGPFVSIADAQRAMRWLRFHAQRLGLDRGRLGLIGFSAGGHVAAGVVADAERARYRATDEVDRERIRPDFCGFFYPVLDMHPDLAHPGSRRVLLAAAGPAVTEADLSPNRRLPGDPPPAFICCALDDPSVPPANSTDLLAALQERRGRVEGHFFQSGGHGFGMRLPKASPAAAWPELLARWMTAEGFAVGGPKLDGSVHGA